MELRELVNQSELDKLLGNCPHLFHMAENGAWAGIKKHGLRSTSSLLNLYQIDGEERCRIESEHRNKIVEINSPGLGTAKIRDQLAMDDEGLRRCLPKKICPRQWYEFLNSKVFFWLTEDRLNRMLNAKAYRNTAHEVLVLNTREFVDKYREEIRLCPINSGATKPAYAKRDCSIFYRIDDYPYKKHKHRVAELSVDGGIEDITNFVKRVYVACGQNCLSDLDL